MTSTRKNRTRTTTTTTNPDLDHQLAHAEAWLAASTKNGDPDVHQAQQRVDELKAQIADGTK